MAGRRFGAEDAVTPFDHVEIDLEDAPLGPGGFQHQGDGGLLGLAPGRLARGKEQVLRQLLGDGGAAGHHLAAALVLFQGFLHPLPVEAFMIDELGVFGCDDRPFQVNRNPLIGNPLLLELGLRILHP
ncbi:hypothetical protein SDC9_207003 [bioreactor metagenome]|uniref:Uncharacterized protein n=1 Tax=bioreactor metagenome TaxID=1076179 RepID=A0A645J824_9ZZZZ